ncbi:MAG: class I SAM-dependent methyltransferase [Proteobacteria bacterium]|nr:class I SAM-dependent methyltransferase [Pseudomonadota bacterium]
MVKNIRPHKVFMLVETQTYPEREMKVILPNMYTAELLTTAIQVALNKIVKTESYFEFGTFLGIQTLNIAMNMPDSAQVYTLDLDKPSFDKLEQDQYMDRYDKPVSEKHFEYADRLAFTETEYNDRITPLYGDSNDFDFSEFEGKLDMVYIDGGHDLRTLKSDTENGFKIVNPDTFSCVAWHDYTNPEFPQIKKYLDEISSEHKIYHVEETTICFCFINAPQAVLDALE